MSKINKKIEMGYDPKPKQKMCSNCSHFMSEFVENEWKYMEEKNIHCVIGGFSIKRTANCNLHVFKENS